MILKPPKTARLRPDFSPPLDEPFALNAEYLNDPSSDKVNLSIGVYRTDEGLPWPLPVVEEAEAALQSKNDQHRHEYLSIQGDVKFLDLARDLAFDFEPNSDADDAHRNRIVSVQTVSGTGANHIGARYLADVAKPRQVWLPNPTWGNHFTIWELVGVKVKTYEYYDAKNRGINFEGIVRSLEEESCPGDVLLLHACAHNPTGSDPSKEQWEILAELCQRLDLVPFFDMAYQGFASGDPSEDAWAIKHFFKHYPDLEFCVAQSFSKNFGLYGQRVGGLHVVLGRDTSDVRQRVLSSLCHLVRGEYSMAPRQGSDTVRFVLQDDILRQKWRDDLASMSKRIKTMREGLYHELVKLGTPGSWVHITSQIGMFSYTGLSGAQVLAVREKYHIYMLLSGRISISGLTEENTAYIARAIDDVVRNVHV